MLNQVMLDKNYDLITTIMKWRSITMKNLKELIAKNDSDSTFRQKIYRLEKGRVIKSKLHKDFTKIIFPSPDLVEISGNETRVLINEDNIRHDSVVTVVSTSLLEFYLVKSIALPHEYKTKSSWRHQAIEPDAIITFEQDEQEYCIALEVELWRKDRKRVYGKLVDYAKADEYDYVFYFFTDRFSLDSYKKRLEELIGQKDFSHLHEDLLKKTVLIFNPLSTKSITDLRNSEIIHRHEKKKLIDFLGD
ncbi:MAG: hypothetical protein K2Q18_04270 [Bdellovibrionales bacterium]|nr:hypothetical protein [Bdellovibrionales bacterium]